MCIAVETAITIVKSSTPAADAISQADIAPAFQLARAGYYVWLGNSRGSKYGNSHITLNPNDQKDQNEFWKFSFEEMGDYDLPE